MSHYPALVVGGGAAGFFGAITCAEGMSNGGVVLLEAGGDTLAKVRVSGGGRCNVTHACWEPRELVKRYPRGGRELLGPFSRWQPKDTVAWFAERGVELKTEADGRMFPVTDDSATIVECLRGSARRAKVEVRTHAGVKTLNARTEGGFQVELSNGEELSCTRLLLATGGTKTAHALAKSLGHTIEEPIPSLFTFNIDDPRLKDLPGLSVPLARAEVVGSKQAQEGPLLVTHWGLSGPAILKLSAWAARDLHTLGYRFKLRINWLGGRGLEDVKRELAEQRTSQARRLIAGAHPPSVPSRLWEKLVTHVGIPTQTQWAGLSGAHAQALALALTQSDFDVTGKSTNKEEFVTCGGVRLKEVDFRAMESRLRPGLHFAGEVLDIDGVTGGFNFQAAWTTGRLAGLAMAESLRGGAAAI